MIGCLASSWKLRGALATALSTALALLFTALLITDTQSVAAQVPKAATPGKVAPGMTAQATTTSPVCRDSYEDDGVPSRAKPLVIGETQAHTFCPAGDADWVTFFAKGGKGYGIETSGLAVGVDTYLNLFAPDGRTLLSTNDDALADTPRASGQRGASRLLFYPQADGWYFVQAKNQGDIGYPGLQYSLSLGQVDISTATPGPTIIAPATQTLPQQAARPTQGTQSPFKADLLHPQNGDGGLEVFEAGPQDALQPDGLEPDDSRESARPINVGAVYKYLNFVPTDLQPSTTGGGSPAVDTDFFTFRAKPGLCYLVQTGDLSSGLDTTILLWQGVPGNDARDAKDKWKLAGQNDDAHPRTPDLSSAVRWCASADSMAVIEVRNYGGEVTTDPRGKSYSLSLVIDPPTSPSPTAAPAQQAAPYAPQLPSGSAIQPQQVPVAPAAPIQPIVQQPPPTSPVAGATATPPQAQTVGPSGTPTMLPPTPSPTPTSTPAPNVSVDVVAYVGDQSSTGPNPGDGIVDLPVLLVDVRTNATIQQTTTDRNGHAQLNWKWQGPVRVALPAFRWGRTLQLADFTSSVGTSATGGGASRGGQLLLMAKMSSYPLPGIYP